MSGKDPYEFDANASSGEEESDDGMVSIKFKPGDVVAAKLGHWEYWPAMIDTDPDTSEFYWVHGKNKTEATHYNVVFFNADGKVNRSWVAARRVVHYSSYFPKHLTEEDLETAIKTEEDLESARKTKSDKRDLIYSRRLAEKALKLDVEERILKHSFTRNYKGKIVLYDDGEGTCQIIDNRQTSEKHGKKKLSNASSSNASSSKASSSKASSFLPAKAKKKPGPKPGRKSKETQSSKTAAVSPKPSSSRSTRRSVATSGPSKEDPKANPEPPRKSEPPSLDPSSLKLRITKDKKNGRHYSTKITVTKDASNELSEQLSEFARSFPPSPGSAVSVPRPTEMPKKRGRKRKSAPKATSKAASKSKKAQPAVPAPEPTPVETVDDVITEAAISPAQTEKPVSSSSPAEPRTVTSPPIAPLAETKKQVGVVISIQQITPPEETMANKISDVIQRMQSQQELPARHQTKKSLSNVGLVVEHDSFVDLTLDDEPETTTWEKGEVVFANLRNVQPWPAVVVGDPSYENKHLSPSTGGPVELVHVVFLEINYHAWVPVGNVNKFNMKDAEAMTTSSHKFLIALQKANAAITMSASDRIATYCASSQPKPIGSMFQGGEPIVLD